MLLILIYDYRLGHADAFPGNPYLKPFCHELDILIAKARQINNEQSLNLPDSFFDQDAIFQPLIHFLTEYAVQARYYNLDYLTGKQQSGLEPLCRWDKEICAEIVKRHYRPSARRMAKKRAFAEEIDTMSYVQYMREDGSEIKSAVELVNEGDLIPVKQKYSMYYLYVIARFASNLVAELEYKGNFYPNLREYFVIFTIDDKKQILKKRTWNPMLP